eukprot:COSAG03_NODE_23333_length_281_cov_0.571429_1_plen_42_part_10
MRFHERDCAGRLLNLRVVAVCQRIRAKLRHVQRVAKLYQFQR